MEPFDSPIDIDLPAVHRSVWVWYARVVKCEIIYGKWFAQFEGLHDKICFDNVAEPPFDKGDLVKLTFERIVQ